jgi:hypothetical protein
LLQKALERLIQGDGLIERRGGTGGQVFRISPMVSWIPDCAGMTGKNSVFPGKPSQSTTKFHATPKFLKKNDVTRFAAWI